MLHHHKKINFTMDEFGRNFRLVTVARIHISLRCLHFHHLESLEGIEGCSAHHRSIELIKLT